MHNCPKDIVERIIIRVSVSGEATGARYKLGPSTVPLNSFGGLQDYGKGHTNVQFIELLSRVFALLHIGNAGGQRCHIYFHFRGDAHQDMVRLTAQGHWQHVPFAVALCRA